MSIELHNDALTHLKSKFNLLFCINARNFDDNWQVLIEKLKEIKVESFSANDRILISHMDTDYYDPLLPVGIIVNNIVRCFLLTDTPLYLLLFVTNHYGISKEFDLLLANHHPNNRPTIVETLLSTLLLPKSNFKKNTEVNADSIEKAGLCMVGIQRSHRIALLNFLKNNNLLSNIAVSVNFSNQ